MRQVLKATSLARVSTRLEGFHVQNTLAYYGEKSFIALVPDRRDSVYSVASRTLKIKKIFTCKILVENCY